MNTFHSGEMEFAAPPVAPQGKKKANQRPIVKVHPPSSAPHLQPARLLARDIARRPFARSAIVRALTARRGQGAWSKEEDATVIRLVGLYGPTRS